MAETYSPLRYPGGKAKLAPFIIQVLKHNGLKEPIYIEPYAGGGGVALRLLFEEYVSHITINDADPRIWCFWKGITQYTNQFLETLKSTKVSISEWNNQREIYRKCNVEKVVELGFATFYLNRTSRSGIIHNGGPIGGFNQTGKYKIDARFTKSTLIKRIERISAYSDRISTTNLDGLALLNSINHEIYTQNKFVYLDPPYYVKGSELYMNRFQHEDHQDLEDYLRNKANFHWLLTYDDAPAIKDLYKGIPQHRFSLSYSAYKRRTGHELLLHSDSINLPDSSYLKLPASS